MLRDVCCPFSIFARTIYPFPPRPPGGQERIMMSPTAEPIHDTTATCQDAGALMATFGITQEPGPYFHGGHLYDNPPHPGHYAQRHLPRSAAPMGRDGADSWDAGALMVTFGIT